MSANEFVIKGWRPRLLPHVIQERALHRGADMALRFLEDGVRESMSLSYADVALRAHAVGRLLRAKAEVGDRVLLIYPPGLDFVIAFCACLMSGLVAVPCPPPGARSRATGRLAAIARDAKAHLLATTESLRAGLQAEEDRGEAWQCVATDQWPGTDAGLALYVERGCDSQHEPQPDDLAFLQYTSGSTGQPKGVMVTQGQLAANLESLRLTFSLTANDVSVTWLPSFHDMGLVDGVLEPLYAGCLGVVIPPVAFLMNPRCWLQALTNHRGTHSGGPSFAYDLLLQRLTPQDWQTFDLSHWRSAYNGAEPVRAEVIERFSRSAAASGFRPEAMVPCYGMAEATLMVTCSTVGRPPSVRWALSSALEQGYLQDASNCADGARAIVGCGAADWGTEVVIADPDTIQALPEGRVGEIWARGPSIAQGYWGQDAMSAEVFGARLQDGRGPFLRTGDLGTLVAGELFVTGRIKDLIILQGRNHYPQDIEASAEASHPALRSSNSAAFSVPGPEGEELVVVMEVERSARHGLDVEAVAAAVRGAVAEGHSAVVECVTLIAPGSLPKTSSGKIQRVACRRAWSDGALKVLGESRRRGADSPASAAPPDALAGIPHHEVKDERAGHSAVKPRLAAAERSTAAGQHPAFADLLNRLVDLAAQVLQVRASLIDPNQALSRAGLDSLKAVRLAADIGRLLGREVAPTLLYDHPTLHSLAQALLGGDGAGTRAEAKDEPLRTPVQKPKQGIAVVGLGCRVPGARGSKALWALLSQGRDATVPMADRRWPQARLEALGLQALKAGLVDGLDTLDETLFGLSPAEARMLDPQQRLLLETSWEALEDAMMPPERLAGGSVGVFVGVSAQDWSRLTAHLAEPATLFNGTGSALSIAANRLSYFYDFQGPSVAVDTACSSSLTALHLACRSLQDGDCDAALVGGVNVLLDLSMSEAFAQAGMLSRLGRCATFDESADGYVRGEGCVVLVLKPLHKAQADGDRILAVVHGTATNQDGRSQGLTAPNGPAQQAVIRAALERAGAQPSDIAYVEAHGTGTALGDPIEAKALEQVFAPGRDPAQALWVGSVKTNVGHLEATAGLMGVAKTVLCLHHRKLVPHLHLKKPNSLVPIGAGRMLQVPQAEQAWPQRERAWAGVSAFGFGGANVHAVLGPAPEDSSSNRPGQGKDVAAASTLPDSMPLMLSAATPEALKRMAEQWAQALEAAEQARSERPDTGTLWAQACVVAAHHRAVLPCRLAVWAAPGDATDGIRRLKALGRAGESMPGTASRPRSAWMFTGQGSIWAGMGSPYMQETAFLAGLAEVAPILEPSLPLSLHDLLTKAPQDALTPTLVAQPLIFAFEWALARWWQAQGAVPSLVMGHSLGEITAAAVAGLITLESAAAFVIERGRIMQRLRGSMVAVAAESGPVLALLNGARWPAGWGLAGDNGARETVLSGPEDGLIAVEQCLQAQGLRFKRMDTAHAFHSQAMDALLPELRAAASALRFEQPRLTWVRSGPALPENTPDYWAAQAREPVRFRQAIQQADAHGVEVWLELGPRPVLCGLVQQEIDAQGAAGRSPVLVASSRPKPGGESGPQQALSAMWACGALPTESLVHRVPQSHPLHTQGFEAPTYPFDAHQHWPGGWPGGLQASVLLQSNRTGPVDRAPFVHVRARSMSIPRVDITPPNAPMPIGLLIGQPHPLRSATAAAFEACGVSTRSVIASPATHAPSALSQMLDEWAAAGAPQPVIAVLMLHAEGAAGAGDPTDSSLTPVRKIYAEVLEVVKAIIAARPLRLQVHIVAQGLSPVASQAAAAVLRVMALEHPTRAGHFIELAPDFGNASDLAALCLQRIGAGRQEWRWRPDGWTVREDERQDRHLVAHPLAAAEGPPASKEGWKGAGVLITGGMGGVGRHLVRALAQRGVAQLWLVGRRLPPSDERAAWERELAERGVRLTCWSIDLEDPGQLSKLAARLAASTIALSDVIHAAGRTADAPLAQQSIAAFDQVAAVQLRAPMQLMAALHDLPWRRFIVCGSAAGMAGSAAQAPYAAAHAALSAWAQEQDRPERRVMALAWGPWRDTGLAASALVREALQSQGVASLDPEDACEGLFEMVHAGWSHVGLFHPRGARPHTPNTPDAAAQPAGYDGEPVARLMWLQSPAALRERHALDAVHDEALAVLGHASTDRLDLHRGFFEIGFDSLSLMTLRQRLQNRWALDLPTTVAFEHPCLSDLARHLHSRMQELSKNDAATPAPVAEAQPGEEATTFASAAQAPRETNEDELARELAAIEKLLS